MESPSYPDETYRCSEAVGSKCIPGYAGEDTAACTRCCKSKDPFGGTPGAQVTCEGKAWYTQGFANNQCQKCQEGGPQALIFVATLAALLLSPILLRVAEWMKHAGQLQGPVLSLTNFFQSADLFRHLDLHWPPQFSKFVQKFASLFNFRLPDLPFVVHPECAFTLTYRSKWLLMLGSPLILFLLL
eukprot:COSAG05_NODE_9214_length_639_cov_1.035185_1_plen_185_part_10